MEIYPVDWEQYSNVAGPLLHTQMVKIADDVIIFGDRKFAGTKI